MHAPGSKLTFATLALTSGQQQMGSYSWGRILGAVEMGFTSPSGKIPSITLVLNLVIVSSLRCGAQRCIPFTPYFTFDHWIPKYRQTRPQSSDAMHRRIFNFPGSSVAAGLPPSPESRAGSFWSEQVGKYYLLDQKPPARSVIRVARNLAEVRR